MGKICELCLLPAGGAPLHKECAELSRDRYRAYWKALEGGAFTGPGMLKNAVQDEKRWQAYLKWENMRLMLLGEDGDTLVPQTRCKPYTSIREFNLAVQEAARRLIALGP